MSGHSKWSKIKRQKAVTDKNRGQLFTKMARLITAAVKQGGGATDPENNFKLRLAIDRARYANMPKENIERAIKRAGGPDSEVSLEEIIYEGYGPGGVAFIVKSLTDNRRRTVAQMKNIFEKHGGKLGEPGTVLYLFDSKGLVVIKTDSGSVDEVMLNIIDIGVEDVEKEEDKILVYTKPSDLAAVSEELKRKGLTVIEVTPVFKPRSRALVKDAALSKKISSLFGELLESEDSEDVFCNYELS